MAVQRFPTMLVAVALTFAVVSSGAGVAWAEGGSISAALFVIEAWDAGQHYGKVEFYRNPAAGPQINWNLQSPVQIVSDDPSQTVLGTVSDLSAYVDSDPVVSIGFAITAPNTSVSYTITSAIVGFAPLVNPPAIASAAITVTDSDGNGAVASPLFAGGTKFFQAVSNVGVYADLITGPLNTAPYASAAASDALPPVGYGSVIGTVSTIQTAFSFNITANDQVSGTGVFVVIPEPGGLAALATGLAGFAAVVLRRRTV
ncbi:MAG: PEP-CTERM sorting domain-containing protein [Armatimonadota bacterium]